MVSWLSKAQLTLYLTITGPWVLEPQLGPCWFILSVRYRRSTYFGIPQATQQPLIIKSRRDFFGFSITIQTRLLPADMTAVSGNLLPSATCRNVRNTERPISLRPGLCQRAILSLSVFRRRSMTCSGLQSDEAGR